MTGSPGKLSALRATRGWTGWLSAALGLAVSAASLAASPAAAAGGTVKEILEKNGLVGVFSGDCRKPASRDNPYMVSRVIDDSTAQIDAMEGPTNRIYAQFIDGAEQIGPSKVRIRGTWDDKRFEFVWRTEANGFVATDLIVGGKILARDGKVVGSDDTLDLMERCKAQ